MTGDGKGIGVIEKQGPFEIVRLVTAFCLREVTEQMVATTTMLFVSAHLTHSVEQCVKRYHLTVPMFCHLSQIALTRF